MNENVAAEHFATAKGWVESRGFKYISARNKEEFDSGLNEFMTTESDRPIFFEVFTHKEEDARIQHEFYNQITEISSSNAVKQGAKKFLKSVLGDDVVRKLKGN